MPRDKLRRQQLLRLAFSLVDANAHSSTDRHAVILDTILHTTLCGTHAGRAMTGPRRTASPGPGCGPVRSCHRCAACLAGMYNVLC
jgi:hypothetical protein